MVLVDEGVVLAKERGISLQRREMVLATERV